MITKNKTLFLCSMLAFLLGIPITLALNINPQNDVKCVLGDCSLTVDASKYLTTTKINQLKAFNLTNYFMKNSNFDLKYYWNGTNITFYSTIEPYTNNYWQLSHSIITIDPWFNYTTSYYNIPNVNYCLIGYPFDEGTGNVANDRCSANDKGSLIGSPSWVSGKYDTALLFASGKHIEINQTSTLNVAGNLTLMAWINTTSTGSQGIFSTYYTTSAKGIVFGVGTTVAGKLQFFNSKGGGWLTSTNTVNDGSYHHVAIVYDTSTPAYTFYIDGIANGTGVAQTSVDTQTTVNYTISYFNSGNEFVGKIDEFKYFNKALTQSEVQTEMNTPINYTVNITNYYTVRAWLNGNESGITLDNATSLNFTGSTNLTGLNGTLYYNGTILQTGTNTITNISYWPVGYYNFTAEFRNASTGGSATYFATIYYTPPAERPIDIRVCFRTRPVCIDTLTNKIYINNNGDIII